MKNIMKKALCFIIAAVLLCTPVAVFAENVDEAWDVGENYVYYGTYLSMGSADYTMSELYEYTLFGFMPEETGEYTFEVADGTIGIVSYNAMWVTVQPNADTITENSVSWNCTGVGQEIWLAVTTENAAANITVTSEASQVVVIPYIPYANKTTPEAFTYSGDVNDLLTVNTKNTTVDTAVLGDDGYYHLNSKDGYVLYANLSDEQMNLYTASTYGQLKGAVRDDEGNLVSITDYNEAFLQYYECADASSSIGVFYPLTEDLIEMFKEIGANKGWYGEDGWVGGKYDDAWMFACYYTDAAFTVTVNGVATQVAAGATIDLSAAAFENRDGAYYRFEAWTGDVADVADAKAAATTVVVNGDLTIDAGYYLIGDVKVDNMLNAMDSNTMRRMVVGNVAIVAAGDTNGDGKVQPIDANLLARMLAGTWEPTE